MGQIKIKPPKANNRSAHLRVLVMTQLQIIQVFGLVIIEHRFKPKIVKRLVFVGIFMRAVVVLFSVACALGNAAFGEPTCHPDSALFGELGDGKCAPVDNVLAPRRDLGDGRVCGRGEYSTVAGEYRAGRTHLGIDLNGEEKREIYAAAPGTIYKYESFPGTLGYIVNVLHEDGTVGRYAHMHKDAYKEFPEDSSVSAGDYIGLVGHSGNAYPECPHLHFEIMTGPSPGADGSRQFSGERNSPLPWLASPNSATILN